MRVNCRNPTEIAKAISWYSTKLASCVRPNLEATLRSYKLTTNDLLRLDEDDFEAKFKLLVSAACEEIRSFRQVNQATGSKGAKSVSSAINTARNAIKMREDSKGGKYLHT